MKEALAVAYTVKERVSRTKTLVGLIPHLPEGLREETLREALAAAREIKDVEHRAAALASLAPHLARWVSHDDTAACAVWKETLHVLSRRTRPELFSDLRALAPFITALGGTEAIAETFRATQDVGCWWP